jgi:two-component sensor histidine kinase
VLTDITQRKNMEEELRERQRELSRLLEEKQTFVQEIHHRVKNNLQMIVSLLSLHARQAHDPAATEALSEAAGRVQAIARLHQTLYSSENLAEINFGEYLHQLARELQQVQDRHEITVHVFADDIVLGMDTAIPLGLIANELILNCFKHAFAPGQQGEVTISVEYVRESVGSGDALDSAAIRLRVQDNGKGLPPGIDFNTTDSMGLRLVQLLGRQLHAEVQAKGGTGLTVSVWVPPASGVSKSSGT